MAAHCLRILAEVDRKFAQVYLAEKRDQVAVLTRGNPQLQYMARVIVESGIQRLGVS